MDLLLDVAKAAREFLMRNDTAAILGGRPTDPTLADVAGLPVFSAEDALKAALRSREAREALRNALTRWEAHEPADNESRS